MQSATTSVQSICTAHASSLWILKEMIQSKSHKYNSASQFHGLWRIWETFLLFNGVTTLLLQYKPGDRCNKGNASEIGSERNSNLANSHFSLTICGTVQSTWVSLLCSVQNCKTFRQQKRKLWKTRLHEIWVSEWISFITHSPIWIMQHVSFAAQENIQPITYAMHRRHQRVDTSFISGSENTGTYLVFAL